MGFKQDLLNFEKAKIDLNKSKVTGKVKAKEEKVTDIKQTKEYTQGWTDADTLLKQYSLYMVCAIVNFSGLCRKDKTHSHKKLYRYCEGVNDRIAKRAKAKKVEFKDGWISQDSIGVS